MHNIIESTSNGALYYYIMCRGGKNSVPLGGNIETLSVISSHNSLISCELESGSVTHHHL
jgi:hypothetical protein